MIEWSRRFADSLLWALTDMAGGNSQRFCDVMAPDRDSDGRNTLLILGDGSYGSILEGRGLKGLPADSMPSLIEGMTEAITNLLGTGTIVTVDFERDPDGALEAFRANASYARESARIHGLDLGDLFEERERLMAGKTVKEHTFLGIWTPRPTDKREREVMLKSLEGDRKKAPPGLREFIRANDVLRARHESSVRAFIAEAETRGYDARPVTAHEALAISRRALFPHITPADWRPFLLGDPVRGSIGLRGRLADLIAPSVAAQVVPGELVRVEGGVWADGRHYRVMGMRIGPTQTEPFSRLIARAGRLPLRIRLRLAGGGLERALGLKRALAQALGPLSATNRQITAAAKALREWVERDHGFVADLRVLFATWGATPEEAESRAAQLRTLVSSWGSGSARPEASDRLARPARALARMVPAFSSQVESWAIPAPINEAVWMLPWSRPVSPWGTGTIDLRTEDGRLYPLDPASRIQTARVTLGFAPMRMGKSLFSNGRILSFILQPGQERLPRVLIVDSGWSSSGLIRLLQDAAPPEKRGQFQHYRVQMDPARFAINPFDLPLGLRAPLGQQRQFVINLITTLCTPLDAKTPPGPVVGFVEALVDAAYHHYGPTSHPRLYYPGVCPDVDTALTVVASDAVPQTWWEAADSLFDAGQIALARQAQAQAMPLLQEVAGLARDPQINSLYAQGATPSGESVPNYIFRTITESLRSLPILTVATRFDPQGARVLALDLGDVTIPSNNPRDHRQAAIMYLLARQMGAAAFYSRQEDVKNLPETILPPRYRPYVEAAAREMERDLKEIIYDEFHRTGGHAGVRSQVLVDIREGPKYNVGVALFSQRPDDFDDSMRNLATTTLVFGAGEGDDVDRMQSLFKFSDAAIAAIKRMRKPDSDGSHVFGRFVTQFGTYEAKLRYTRGPTEIWALSTTPADNAVMKMVAAALGATEARRRLALQYPGGTVENEVERRLRALMDRGIEADAGAASGQVLAQIAEEVIARA